MNTHLPNLKKKKFRKYQKASSRRPLMPEGQCRKSPMQISISHLYQKVTYIRRTVPEGHLYQKAAAKGHLCQKVSISRTTILPFSTLKNSFFHPFKKYLYSVETKFCGISVKVPQISTQFPPTNFHIISTKFHFQNLL